MPVMIDQTLEAHSVISLVQSKTELKSSVHVGTPFGNFPLLTYEGGTKHSLGIMTFEYRECQQTLKVLQGNSPSRDSSPL